MAPKEQIFKCRECAQSFTWRPHLTRHIKSVHIRAQTFYCVLCGSTFARLDNLKKHQKRMHPSSTPPQTDIINKQTPYQAPVATAEYTRPSTLSVTSSRGPALSKAETINTSSSAVSSFPATTSMLENIPTRLSEVRCNAMHRYGAPKFTAQITSASLSPPFESPRSSNNDFFVSSRLPPAPTPASYNDFSTSSVVLWPANVKLEPFIVGVSNLTAPSTSANPPSATELVGVSGSTAPFPKPTAPALMENPTISFDKRPAASAPSTRKRKASARVSSNNKKYKHTDDVSLHKLPTDIRKIYRDNWETIHTHHKIGKKISTYTFYHTPKSPFVSSWSSLLTPIFEKQTRRFKINYSHHSVLRHRETNELRFFHACINNASVLPLPKLINNPSDFDDFISLVNNSDIVSSAGHGRDDTKFTVEIIPSSTFFLFHLDEHPLGCCLSDLPTYITKNKGIRTLQKDSNSKTYTDNLCFFRCLALYSGSSDKDLRKATRELFRQWRVFNSLVRSVTFPGVSLKDINSLESCFKVNISVFQFDNEQVLIPLLRTSGKFDKTMHVLVHEQHFMYISKIAVASKSFGCHLCGKLWKYYSRLQKHEKNCTSAQQKEVYKAGVYTTPDTILEKISAHGVKIPDEFTYPFRASFDFETYFSTEDLPTSSNSTQYVAKHVPLSCSIASNIDKFQGPFFFVSKGEPQVLVNEMLDQLIKLADAAYALLLIQFASVFAHLESLGEDKLSKKLEAYLQELPVIGFNSGNYDLNLIKPFLVRYFVSKNSQSPFNFVVKRNNNFMCLATEKLKFLDISNYLAPGFSYSKYLAAYNVKETKGVFCYEYIKNISQLDELALPPHSAFFSSLKNSNISEAEYADCQKVWTDKKMTSLKDFLEWYNNKDVVPFIEALQKQSDFYVALGVDLFKSSISVPGICLNFLWRTMSKNVSFAQCSRKEADLHNTLKQNVVGGPSLIFHRNQEKNKTRIRGGKVVQGIKGYDANALYLWALSQQMPTDFPVIRKKEEGFKFFRANKYGYQSREWLVWVSHSNSIELKTQFNSREMSLGARNIKVDGWDKDTRTAYQFHGCLFHGHPNCHLTAGLDTNPVNKKPLSVLYEKTQEITKYLREEVGVRVVEVWECEWGKMKKSALIAKFLRGTFPRLTPSWKNGPITEETIIAAVLDDSFFGLVECDISVPDKLKPYFEEMTPIFKNINVTRDDIGPFMYKYAVEHKLLTSPRRTLVGSYIGTKIMLATPLLKWYLLKGLVVTNIYQIVEYQPVACFKAFGETVSDARRQADSDPSYSIKGETMKLLGNSAYGKTLTNKTKHSNVSYCLDKTVSKKINDPLFKQMTQLSDNLFEVELLKNKIVWDLPLQIGFFVYQYAKLRMLAFYYDFLDKYIDRSDFQLCEMDTDSLYLALSSGRLSEVVRPGLRAQYFEEYDRWFPSEVCLVHRPLFISSEGSVPVGCQDCCKTQKHEKRTPGLFKLEYEGDGMISLCSKTYHCFGKYDKTSTKGLSKHHNTVKKEKFLQVLTTQQPQGGINRGFRTRGASVFTYNQHRDSLSYFYIKRQVHSDGFSTSPLNI